MMDAVTRLVVYAFAGFVGAFAVTAGVGLVVIFLLHWLGSPKAADAIIEWFGRVRWRVFGPMWVICTIASYFVLD
jgi:hypothetical protein